MPQPVQVRDRSFFLLKRNPATPDGVAPFNQQTPQKMDTRKLTASGNSEELRTMDGNMVATTDNLLVKWPLEEKQAMIRELARRWNTHPDLLAALQTISSTAAATEDAYAQALAFAVKTAREAIARATT